MASEPAVASRREHIIRAALELLGECGPAGVTHRAVATRAGVPLAATTYYFSSKAHLLREALALLAGEEVARLEAVRATLGRGAPDVDVVAAGIATVLAEQVGARAALAKFEVYLDAGRGAELRPTAAAAADAFVALATDLFTRWGTPDPQEAARVAVAGIDGLLLHELLRGGPLDAERLAGGVARLLRALRGG